MIFKVPPYWGVDEGMGAPLAKSEIAIEANKQKATLRNMSFDRIFFFSIFSSFLSPFRYDFPQKYSFLRGHLFGKSTNDRMLIKGILMTLSFVLISQKLSGICFQS
jgi:hypothetical protein